MKMDKFVKIIDEISDHCIEVHLYNWGEPTCKIGMVGVNVPILVPMAFHNFGGWKQSIFGVHAMHGLEGIHFYTKHKTVTSRWPKSIQSGPEFVMPRN